MPILNVAFLNPSLRKATGEGTGQATAASVAADELSILENELGKDGFLSAGDYDLLIQKAKQIQTSGILKPAQVSDYNVKISGYEKNKGVISANNVSDLDKLQNDLKIEQTRNVMAYGDSPTDFIQMKKASYADKLNILSAEMQKREQEGRDYSEYMNDYQEIFREYNEVLAAEAAQQQFDPNNPNPASGMAAYVETNAQGDIVDIDYAPIDDRAGFAETDAILGGFTVYGKTYKQDGKNNFRLGRKKFTAADTLQMDPNNPSSFLLKPTKLSARTNVDATGQTQAAQGYDLIDPNTIAVQTYVPRGGYARGTNGTLYERKEDGSFVKYINMMSDKDFDVGTVINIPPEYEQNYIGKRCNETVDFGAALHPQQPAAATGGALTIGGKNIFEPGTGPDWMSGLSSSGQRKSTMETPTPAATPGAPAPFTRKTSQTVTPQASSNWVDTAKRTVQGGLDYLKNKFIA